MAGISFVNHIWKHTDGDDPARVLFVRLAQGSLAAVTESERPTNSALGGCHTTYLGNASPAKQTLPSQLSGVLESEAYDRTLV